MAVRYSESTAAQQAGACGDLDPNRFGRRRSVCSAFRGAAKTSYGETETLDQTTTYDAIELFGLTENGTDDLIIPNDDALRDQIVLETFETLIGGL